MKTPVRVLLIFSILFLCIFSDQLSKSLARTQLAHKDSVSFVYDTLTLRLTSNDGAFLSMLSFLPKKMKVIVLQLGVAVVLALLLAFLFIQKNMTSVETISYSLFTGGGISNLIDRLMQDGHVTDFLHFAVGPLRTGILNLADIYITAGVVLLLVYSIKFSVKYKTRQKQNTETGE